MVVKDTNLPTRRKLPHEIPLWIEQGARHFVTINCRKRGIPLLLENDIAIRLLKGAKRYEEMGKWYLWLMLVMPDHLHFIVTFNLNHDVRKVLASWKSYQAKTLGIEWQSGYFEHRLRNDREFEEKCMYIRQNPMRKGLCPTAKEWSYYVDRTRRDPRDEGRAKPPAEPQRVS
ncbi:MAG: transposase [Kiritimatiellae bacterium]|nr:transposase [Kiritimatiellia bacterium]MDD4735906.1 transposase [Kiritimatiellia bacterium]